MHPPPPPSPFAQDLSGASRRPHLLATDLLLPLTLTNQKRAIHHCTLVSNLCLQVIICSSFNSAVRSFTVPRDAVDWSAFQWLFSYLLLWLLLTQSLSTSLSLPRSLSVCLFLPLPLSRFLPLPLSLSLSPPLSLSLPLCVSLSLSLSFTLTQDSK